MLQVKDKRNLWWKISKTLVKKLQDFVSNISLVNLFEISLSKSKKYKRNRDTNPSRVFIHCLYTRKIGYWNQFIWKASIVQPSNKKWIQWNE